MKAVILAAGIGSRLRPITDEKPKTLVNVNNKPMLGYILDALSWVYIKEVVICVGYKASHIINYCKSKYPQFKFYFIENKEYDTTNNMYSLYLAKKQLDDDIVLMNADLIFDKDIVKGLLKSKGSRVAVDKGIYIEESMKITVNNSGIISGISKKINKEDAYGSSIDVYKIEKDSLDVVVDEMKRIIEDESDRNQWTEVMLNIYLCQEN